MNTKGRKLPAETYTPDEIRRLLATCSRKAPTGVRNRALLATLWRCGLRISEALDLRLKDVDHEGGTIRVLDGKGHKPRTVGVDDETMAMIGHWAALRAEKNINGREPLFCTLAGGRMHTAYIRALLPRLARKAKVEKRVHAHGFRHTHAVELRTEGVDIGVISKQLGHSSIATTSTYLDHLKPQQVVDTMRKRKWSE